MIRLNDDELHACLDMATIKASTFLNNSKINVSEDLITLFTFLYYRILIAETACDKTIDKLEVRINELEQK